MSVWRKFWISATAAFLIAVPAAASSTIGPQWVPELSRQAAVKELAINRALVSQYLAKSEAEIPLGPDPCQPFYFTYNPDEIPYGWDIVLADAVRRVNKAAGVRFQWVEYSSIEGTVWENPDKRGSGQIIGEENDEPIPMLIHFATELQEPRLDEVRKLEGYRGISGFYSREYGVAPSGRKAIRGGLMVLNLDAIPNLEPSSRYPKGHPMLENRYDRGLNVVMHELGHALGIEHPKTESGSLMWQDVLRDGDLNEYDQILFASAGAIEC